MSMTLWHSGDGKPPSAIGAPGPWFFSPDGVASAADAAAAPAAGRQHDQALIVPGAPGDRGVAMLMIPEELAGRVACNGQPLAAGAHVLSDRDRLDFGPMQVWVSRGAHAAEVRYNPAQHGADVFCARTRGRLHPGETIVICPGTSNVRCGMLYKAEAWALGLRCHYCGFDPRAQNWKPPVKEKEHWNELLRLAARKP